MDGEWTGAIGKWGLEEWVKSGCGVFVAMWESGLDFRSHRWKISAEGLAKPLWQPWRKLGRRTLAEGCNQMVGFEETKLPVIVRSASLPIPGSNPGDWRSLFSTPYLVFIFVY